MKVLKFGGSSVATADAIRSTIEIVRTAYTEGPIVVVVSALGGVTDELLRAASLAATRDGETDYRQILGQLKERHHQTRRDLGVDIASVLTGSDGDRIDELFDELSELLHGAFLLREASPRALDRIASYGEQLSTSLVAAALSASDVPARAVSATDFVVTDDRFGAAQVDLDETSRRAREVLVSKVVGAVDDEPESRPQVAVVTGFIGSTLDGEVTTLGRGGSDYTAALVGAALDATAIELWTDVPGVMSADPRWVAAAKPIDRMSFAELMELSHFGAKVVYPPTVGPARTKGIPLVIRSTFAPSEPGTEITERATPGRFPIRGVSSISSIALLRVEGDGMIAVPGIAARLFGALAGAEVNVVLISQGSSEHSICFAVEPMDAERAATVIRKEFALERGAGKIDEVIVESDLSVLAVVGEGMRERHGIAGRLFGILGDHGINIRVITQGSSELNITIAVDSRDESAALNAIHSEFFGADERESSQTGREVRPAGPRRRVEIVLAGVGQVGSALLEQIQAQRTELSQRLGIDLSVVGLLNSRRMVIRDGGLDLDSWRADLAAGSASDPQVLVDRFGRSNDGGEVTRILVDCTAAESLGGFYRQALDRGISVVAANKRPVSGPLTIFKSLTEGFADRDSGGELFYEATAGAGLPVISTIRTLVASGDRIERIDGVLSGTLNFVLDLVDQGTAFSAAVRQAYDLGYTEPHPADDLSGMDVARKLLILGRTAGWPMETSAVGVESLSGAGSTEAPIDDLWRRLRELDPVIETRRAEAANNGERLRYVAAIESGQGRVGLVAVGDDHPCFGVRGADNLVAVTSRRYRDRPLVVSGPGAGAEVTAAGVFGDILLAVQRHRR